MDDIEKRRNEIAEMRSFMKAANVHEPTSFQPRRIPFGSREQVEARIVSLTEHIYMHVKSLDSEDFQRGLHSQMDAVLTGQTVDEMAIAIRRGDKTRLLELSRELHQHLGQCTEEEFSVMLENVGFRGEEYDLQGLMAMLGHLLADIDGNRIGIQESVEADRRLFGNLIRDLAHLVNKWSHPRPVASGPLSEERNAETCANEIRELLEQQYGISVETKSGP